MHLMALSPSVLDCGNNKHLFSKLIISNSIHHPSENIGYESVALVLKMTEPRLSKMPSNQEATVLTTLANLGIGIDDYSSRLDS